MNKDQVITSVEEMTANWITNVLQKQGYIKNGKVKKLAKRDSHETVESDVYFLHLTFSDDVESEGVSSDIVVKLHKPDILIEYLGKHEAKFYDIIAKNMKGLPVPTCYYAEYSDDINRPFTILENMSKTHEELTVGPPLPPSRQYCEKAIDCLSEIHAFWWDHKDLQEFFKHSFALYTCKENSYNENGIMSWFNNEKYIFQRMFQSVGDSISHKRKELCKKIFSSFPQLALERSKENNITLVHGDPHFWNFFYPKELKNEQQKAVLFDWSLWALGAGAQDLAYMIGIFWIPDTRGMMEVDLLKRYHDNLLNFGIDDYSWDDCWYDYRLNTILNLYRVVFWWNLGSPADLWWGALNNVICAIEDLNCMDLLKD